MITQCETITTPGSYVLGDDLSSGPTCLSILNAHNVRLDCAGHTITSTRNTVTGVIDIESSDNISLTDCSSAQPPIVEPDGYVIHPADMLINNCQQVRVTQSHIESIDVSGLQNGLFSGNQITGYYRQMNASGVTVSNNSVTVYGNSTGAAGIIADGGQDNQILNNFIDGSWNGDPDSELGADDGIVVQGENGDTVTGNTIQNVWDLGIEPDNSMTDTLIANNIIRHCNVGAIGSYKLTSWYGNTIANNQASDVPELFDIFFQTLPPPPAPTTIYFQNNSFSNNSMSFQRVTNNIPGPGGSISFDYFNPTLNPGTSPLYTFISGNNVMMGNNFDSAAAAPYLSPAEAFVDGGGNICQPGPNTVIACHP